MTATQTPEYPADWDYNSHFTDEVLEVAVGADLSWLQVVVELSFVLAVILAAGRDDEQREAMGAVLGDKLREVGATGRVPSEWLQ